MESLTWFVLLLAGLTCTHAVGTSETIQNLPSICQVEFRVFLVWTHNCACSVLTTGHIISVNSCFQASPSNRQIRLGTATSGWGGITREVGSIINHPLADLTVVRLTNLVWFGPTIQNVPIVPQGFSVPENVPLSIAGWGYTAQGGLFTNPYLYRAWLESKNITLCMNQHPGRVTTDNLCVGLIGSAGRDFDSDDAGAPILYEGFLTGLASFGAASSNNNLPIVATAIGPYTNWIVGAAV
ncbi:unnamed protein product [Arctia plantaginis]|uniref:Peptidase S1 domain-containing protein n=1 Tax=Arctia plantaginis TaxID=874455 RepID=A0A8S1A0M1_ARCPL|nr:unnamed protein product [Arctia plantaginis]CAB3238087.1 unnamed protein product [Arctia plantaginis]